MREKIKKAKKEGRIIIGYKETLKNLEEVEEVLLARNTPLNTKKRLKKRAGDKIKEIDLTNMIVGEILGKPFSVSCLGIK